MRWYFDESILVNFRHVSSRQALCIVGCTASHSAWILYFPDFKLSYDSLQHYQTAELSITYAKLKLNIIFYFCALFRCATKNNNHSLVRLTAMAEINIKKSRRIDISSHNITPERFKRSSYGNFVWNFLNLRNIFILIKKNYLIFHWQYCQNIR